MAFSFRAGTNWCHDFPKLARESGFHFNMHRRRVRVDWNRISSIDVDRVIGDRDFSTIDDNVNNVVDYCLESEYDVKILDPNFVKLFRLAQLAVEYLLYCKQYLDHSVVILNEELRSKQEENTRLKSDLKDDEKIIKGLREKIRDRSRIVETRLSDSNGEIHKCPQCPKTFISALFMSAHVNRRHPNFSRTSLSSPVHEQYKAETEKLHSEIKSLKERLNLTERVIRNESEKFLSSDSVVSNDNREMRNSEKYESRNNRERDEIIAEQHRRYQEEIGNLKATIFDEIRNLKFADRYPRGKSENDEFGNSSIKELIREQENEIKRLRQQICAKPTPEVDEIATKPDNQEDIWRSKIENLETRYRTDIEKLYEKLRVNQESSDRMLVDYQTRMSELERREASLESTLNNQSRNENHEKSLFFTRHDDKPSRTLEIPDETKISSLIHESSTKKRVDDEITSDCESDESFENPVSPKNSSIRDTKKEITRKSSSIPKTSRNRRRDRKNEEIELLRTNENKNHRNNGRNIEKSNFHERLTNGETNTRLSSNLRSKRREKMSNHESREHKSEKIEKKSMHTDVRGMKEKFPKKRDFVESTKKHDKLQFSAEREKLGKMEKNDDPRNVRIERNLENYEDSEIFSDEEEEESESWLESESQENSSRTDEEEEEEEEEIKDDRSERKDQRRVDEKSWNYERETNQDGMEIFRSKLREFGIDPDWRGIPDATFAQVLEIVRHHRTINSKKYRKFEDIRRKLLHQLTRRLSIKEKDHDKIADSNEQTQLERLVTNVKTKVSKAFNILEKNDGSRSTRPISATNKIKRHDNEQLRKISTHRTNSFIVKSNPTIVNETKKSLYPRDSMTSEDSYDNNNVFTKNEEISSNENIPRRVNTMKKPMTNDLRRLSKSYDSIKDFIKDTNSRQTRKHFDASANLVTSTPHKIVDIPIGDSSPMANETASNSMIRGFNKRNEDISAISVNSPKNSGKSVLKSTIGGSVASLTKKKVLFDLETSERITTNDEAETFYPRREKEENNTKEKNSSESDFEMSSIHDETEQFNERKNDSSQSGKVVILKTSQSEKIAQISQQIEAQLSLSRRKPPAGSIEAMFREKLTNDSAEIVESPINVYPNFTSPTRLINDGTTTKTRKQWQTYDEAKKWQKSDSRLSNEEKREIDMIDENLDMDIDELLQME